MQAGDIIPLEIPKTITAHVDGIPVMDCHYGIMNGQYALRVNAMISPSETE